MEGVIHTRFLFEALFDSDQWAGVAVVWVSFTCFTLLYD
jgi:hypothetical protein